MAAVLPLLLEAGIGVGTSVLNSDLQSSANKKAAAAAAAKSNNIGAPGTGVLGQLGIGGGAPSTAGAGSSAGSPLGPGSLAGGGGANGGANWPFQPPSVI